ncbi:predicted protein [Botrytis cinerea T4]|uniref:Uncharacterized protein n=1 Tax=Botryotinia fuckeliana (strain T4) TaxID=999810 RepID=G2YEU2_BOTF4|nr:predicted protein [Botrytis cinerea T4]
MGVGSHLYMRARGTFAWRWASANAIVLRSRKIFWDANTQGET